MSEASRNRSVGSPAGRWNTAHAVVRVLSFVVAVCAASETDAAKPSACLEQHFGHEDSSYSETRRGVDSLGRLAMTTVYDDSMALLTQCNYYYDHGNRLLVELCEGETGPSSVTFRYDSTGRLSYQVTTHFCEQDWWGSRFRNQHDLPLPFEFAFFGPFGPYDFSRFYYYDDEGRLTVTERVSARGATTVQSRLYYGPGRLERHAIDAFADGVVDLKVIVTRDDEGRILSEALRGSSFGPPLRLYTYDERGLLVSEVWSDLERTTPQTVRTLEYDDRGRLIEQIQYSRRDGSIRDSTLYYYDCQTSPESSLP